MKMLKMMVVAAAFCAWAAFGVELSWQRDVLREILFGCDFCGRATEN